MALQDSKSFPTEQRFADPFVFFDLTFKGAAILRRLQRIVVEGRQQIRVIWIHAPKEWQQSLVAENELPPRFNCLDLAQIILEQLVSLDLVDQPLFGIGIDQTINCGVKELHHRHAIRCAPSCPVSVSQEQFADVLHYIGAAATCLVKYFLEVEHLSSTFVVEIDGQKTDGLIRFAVELWFALIQYSFE